MQLHDPARQSVQGRDGNDGLQSQYCVMSVQLNLLPLLAVHTRHAQLGST